MPFNTSNLNHTLPAWERVCETLHSNGDTPTLSALMRVSATTYDIAYPLLYRKPSINERNIKSFLLGLKPSLRDNIRPPPSKKRRIGATVTPYRPDDTTQKRKLRLLEKVCELHLLERPFNGVKRHQQLDRHAPILAWCLGSATEASLLGLRAYCLSHLMLSALRKIVYSGDIQTGSYRHRLKFIIHLDPISTSSPTLPPTSTSTPTRRSRTMWDICIHLEPIVDEPYLSISPSELNGIKAIRDWLDRLSTTKAIRHLSIHSDNPTILFPLCFLRWSGSFRVFMTRPQVRHDRVLEEAGAYAKILSKLLKELRGAGHSHVQVYDAMVNSADPANSTVPATLDVLRDLVFTELLETHGIARIPYTSRSEQASMAPPALGKSGLWLAPITSQAAGGCLCADKDKQGSRMGKTDLTGGDILMLVPPSTLDSEVTSSN